MVIQMKKIEVTTENCIMTTHPEIAKQWHPTKNGVLTPYEVRAGSTDKVWWKCEKGHNWITEVRVRCQRNNGCPYCSGRLAIKGETDLFSQFPKIASEWDYEENGNMSPADIPQYSLKRVKWICNKGHKWSAQVEKRTLRNQGCPYCSGRYAIPGETDVSTTNPEIIQLWDFDKNSQLGLILENCKAGSDKEVFWKCEKGHSWKTKIKYVALKGHRCPYCANVYLDKGKTDLESVNPKLAAEWHQIKNGVIKPCNVFARTRKKYWWRCDKGHEWEAAVYHRNDGENSKGCPYCAGIRTIVGENDLATKRPDLLAEFIYSKNRRKPQEIHYGSSKKYWWRCPNCGHQYRSAVCSRTKLGTNCPKCNGKESR